MYPQDYDVCGYQYRASEYCPLHALEAFLRHEGFKGHGLSLYYVEEALDLLARCRGINRGDEYSFDSDDFPKVILGYQAEDADSHCETCREHLRTIEQPQLFVAGLK